MHSPFSFSRLVVLLFYTLSYIQLNTKHIRTFNNRLFSIVILQIYFHIRFDIKLNNNTPLWLMKTQCRWSVDWITKGIISQKLWKIKQYLSLWHSIWYCITLNCLKFLLEKKGRGKELESSISWLPPSVGVSVLHVQKQPYLKAEKQCHVCIFYVLWQCFKQKVPLYFYLLNGVYCFINKSILSSHI